jgi:predicted ribosome quality control (RQC) complex YloA/Tae2 family protein
MESIEPVAEPPTRALVDEQRQMLRRALAKALARIDRRLGALALDLEKVADAAARAETARLFVAEAARAPRGADRLIVKDWSTGRETTIELDRSKDARTQLEAIFKRARRLRNGASFTHERLHDARAARAALVDLLERLEVPETDPTVIAALAQKAAPRDVRLGLPKAASDGARQADGPRPPYRIFVGRSGGRILVGRGALHNDELTVRVAKPHDLWLHARNFTGAHVVVPLPRGASCPADLLVDAAHLAAHFSSAREEATVEIEYTPRRYVRKPRRSPPGAVLVTREKVMILRRLNAGSLLRGLLASELVVESGRPGR